MADDDVTFKLGERPVRASWTDANKIYGRLVQPSEAWVALRSQLTWASGIPLRNGPQGIR